LVRINLSLIFAPSNKNNMYNKEYFTLNKSFDYQKDEILMFLALDDNKDYATDSPDKMMLLSEYEQLSANEVGTIFRSNQDSNFSIFQKFRKEQLEELQRSKQELRDFYTTPWDYSQFENGCISPMDIARLTLQKKIRVARIREILEPQFAEVLVPHSKTKHKYWAARAYWWNDYGIRSRSVTKTIRRSDVEIVDRLKIVYEDLDYEIILNARMKNNTIADMVIKKPNEAYVVEVKKMNFNYLARFILTMGMWLDYKKLYFDN